LDPDLMSITSGRARQLRIITGMSQAALAARIGCSTATLNRFESGAGALDPALVRELADALGCTEDLLARRPPDHSVRGPWLRAYADASKRSVDAYVEESKLAVELIDELNVTRRHDRLPTFDADPADDAAIEEFAEAVRAAADIQEGAFVGNATRAAERLGCLVLPTEDELGRHLGMSLVVDGFSVVRVARPQIGGGIPGVGNATRSRMSSVTWPCTPTSWPLLAAQIRRCSSGKHTGSQGLSSHQPSRCWRTLKSSADESPSTRWRT